MSIVGDALTILQIIATLHDYYSVFTGNRERCRLLCERCYAFEAPMKALTQNRSKHSHISAASVSQLLKTLRDCREFLRKFTKESWFRFCKNAMLAKSIEGEFKALNQRLLQSSNDLQLPIHIDTKAEVVAMAQDMKQLLMKQERVCESGMIINDDVKIQLNRMEAEQDKGQSLIEAMYSKMALFERVLGDLYDKQMESSAALMELAEASDADAESSLKEAADDRMESKVPSMEYYLRHVVRLDERLLEWNDNDAASKIGEGSFDVVYRCIYGGRDCAVKKFHSIERATDSDMRRLAKEARIMDLVSHPYIIEFCGLSLECGLLVMERAVCSMWDLLYSNKSPAELGVPSSYTFNNYDKLNALSQVALAMYYLHTRNVLHRDIKPDNILFVYDPRKQPHEQFVAKLADFGIAVAVGFTTFGSASSSMGTGTYVYMAPELLACKTKDPYSMASDIYALGTTINEVLAGQRPWTTTEGTVLQKAVVVMRVCVAKRRPTIFKDEENRYERLRRVIGGDEEGKGCWAHDPSLLLPSLNS